MVLEGCFLVVALTITYKAYSGMELNQVVSHRMAKNQQMRWSDEGVRCLAQVRVAVFNGELPEKGLAQLAQRPCANSPHARLAA
jgi:hypothetical protein